MPVRLFPVRRRILLLITDLEIGGTPAVVRELAVRLRDATHAHIEVAGLSQAGPLQDQLFTKGVKCTALGAEGPRDLKITRTLYRLLRHNRIDTVFSFLIHANTLAAAMRLVYPHARYFQSIQTTQPNPAWHWTIQRLIHPAAEKIVVPSPSVAAAAQRWSGVPMAKIVVIPNAIDPADFGGADGPPVNRQQQGTFNIGFIGRLDPIKRIPDLLQAITLIPGSTHLHIFGQGAQRPLIEATITQLKLTNRVTLHGAIERPQEALEKIDLLVLPSQAEGFGLVLIEAMAAGVPVVATNVPGIRDVVIDNETGLLVPPRSPAEIARAIRKIIDDPGLRARLIENGAKSVRERFTWDKSLPQYLKLLQL
jgi:glycosyltransferase involved in cell wall biosynthesis